MIKVTLSPVFDSYMLLNDLEQDLKAANLVHLLPSDKGARLHFNRVINQTSTNYGVTFEVLKETRRDIMWTVRDGGKRNIGTYMVIYDIPRKGALPKFAGGKSRYVNKGRSAEERHRFDDICKALDDSLYNLRVNSYSFHLRVSEWCKQHADVIEKRPTGNGLQKTEARLSNYYYLNDRYLPELQSLGKIYGKFGMNIDTEEVS